MRKYNEEMEQMKKELEKQADAEQVKIKQ